MSRLTSQCVHGQDAALAANVHQIAVASAPWYKERHVANTTLGSLLAVVLLRTAHANLAKLQVHATLDNVQTKAMVLGGW